MSKDDWPPWVWKTRISLRIFFKDSTCESSKNYWPPPRMTDQDLTYNFFKDSTCAWSKDDWPPCLSSKFATFCYHWVSHRASQRSFTWKTNKHVQQVKDVHVYLDGSSIVDRCLHMLTYICIWIIHIYRHNNNCLFSCIFVCISNRVIYTGTFVHLVHIHVHLKDGTGVDICMRFIFAYAYVHMQIYMFTCKPTYVHL